MSSFYYKYMLEKTPLTPQAYRKSSDRIIGTTMNEIADAKKNGADLQALFFHILEKLGEERRKMTKVTGNKEWHLYGVRRDDPKAEKSVFASLFEKNLPQYRDQSIQLLVNDLQHQNYSELLKTRGATKLKEGVALERKYSMEYELYPPHARKLLALAPDYEGYKKMCSAIGVVPKPAPLQRSYMDEIAEYSTAKKLKANDPSLYRQYKVSFFHYDLYLKYNIKHPCDWLFATARIDVQGKMYGLCSYLTWLNEDGAANLLPAMKDRAMVYILKTDRFLIEPLLQEVAAIFKKAVSCHTNDFEEIKKQMTLFKYLFSHITPFARGNSAISEWIEQAVYKSHGYDVTYNDEKMATFEALTSTLEQFAGNYDTLMTFNEYNPESGSVTVLSGH